MKFTEGPGGDFYHIIAAALSYDRIHSYSARDEGKAVNLYHNAPADLQSEILHWLKRG
jgi:hypothetical protein